MELKKSILGRRSIRKYKDKKVPIEIIHDIFDMARFSPSSGNTQCWKFIIVENKKKRTELATAALEQMWMSQAPIHIIVCNQHKKVTTLYGKLGRIFSIQDCSIISSYLMLLAREKGLGTCWVGAFDPEAVKRILNIPEDVDPEAIITLGYPERIKLSNSNRKDIKDILFFDEWNSKEQKTDKKNIINKISSKLKK